MRCAHIEVERRIRPELRLRLADRGRQAPLPLATPASTDQRDASLWTGRAHLRETATRKSISKTIA